VKAFFDHWANTASVLGLLASIIGFVFTLFGVWKSKNAAKRAEEAALKTQEALSKSESITNCSTALYLMDEIKILHREVTPAAWDKALDRYSLLRRALSALKSDNNSFTVNDMATIQGVIKQISGCESKIEKAKSNNSLTPDTTVRLNEILSKQIGKIHDMQTKLKITIRTIKL